MGARLDQLRWSSAQAGVTLSLASSAWLLSGLTPSPLINALLPALTTAPALLPIRRRARGLFLIVLSTAVLVLICSPWANPLPPSLAITAVLLASHTIALGQDISQLPLQLRLLRVPNLKFQQLRRGTELGALAGFSLTGLIHPGVHQFIPAALLLVPLLPTAFPSEDQSQEAIALPAFNITAALQGLIFGGFFGLLPLWVRSIADGNCFNFGVVLAAYGIGRTLCTTPSRRSGWALYGPIAGLLIAGQFLPGWATSLLFIPIGCLAAATDRQIVKGLTPLDPAQGWQILQRSGAIGGLIGVLAMGVIAQSIGLPRALLVQLGLFITAPILLRYSRQHSAAPRQ